MTTFDEAKVKRVSAGDPASKGGQFAEQQKTASTAAFPTDAVDETDWGHVTVAEGSRTPWGSADVVNHPADGIVVVHTPGHGGIKLSKERNARINPSLRNASGWYEEDCESSIVGMYHPEAFPHYFDGDHDQIMNACEKSVIDWFPDEYEKATGQMIQPGMSYTRDQQLKAQDEEAFRAEHANEWLTTQRATKHDSWVNAWIPEGQYMVEAEVPATGEKRMFLVDEATAVHDHTYRKNVIIDPHRHLDVTDIEKIKSEAPWELNEYLPSIKGGDVQIRTNRLSLAQQSKVEAELLNKRWRFHDDDGVEHVETLADNFRRRGVKGKHASNGPTSTDYYVEYGDKSGRVMKVSKAAFDSLAIPDTTTEVGRASIAVANAERREERARRNFDWDKARKAQEAAHAARSHLNGVAEADSERRRLWQNERTELQKAAFAELLAERGMDA